MCSFYTHHFNNRECLTYVAKPLIMTVGKKLYHTSSASYVTNDHVIKSKPIKTKYNSYPRQSPDVEGPSICVMILSYEKFTHMCVLLGNSSTLSSLQNN